MDTHWVASFLNGRPEAAYLFHAITFEETALSLISYGEILEGIYFGSDPVSDEALFRQFLRGVTVLPLNRRRADWRSGCPHCRHGPVLQPYPCDPERASLRAYCWLGALPVRPISLCTELGIPRTLPLARDNESATIPS